MANNKTNIRDELRSYKFEYGLLQKIPCTKQENEEYRTLLEEGEELPEGVDVYVDNLSTIPSTDFYTTHNSDLTEFEIMEYLTYKQLKMIKTIKNCVLFFTVLTIIGMIAYFLLLFN